MCLHDRAHQLLWNMHQLDPGRRQLRGLREPVPVGNAVHRERLPGDLRAGDDQLRNLLREPRQRRGELRPLRACLPGREPLHRRAVLRERPDRLRRTLREPEPGQQQLWCVRERVSERNGVCGRRLPMRQP